MNTSVLQIHGQEWEHDDAFIVGTADELLELSRRLAEAAESASGYARVNFFSGDGEGYKLYVIRVSKDEAGRLPHQYTDGHDRGTAPDTLSLYDLLAERRAGN